MAKTDLMICHENITYHPDVLDGVRWTSERKGTPSKLTFKILNSDLVKMEISEGDQVTFKWEGNKVFYGYVFTIRYDESDVIDITAYDQLRYLTNVDTYVYENKTASDVIQMIADKFNLKYGDTIEKTPYLIKSRIEDSQTLYDIINNALDLTVQHTNKLYVFYDDFGKLTLKNADSMLTSVIITAGNASGYSYSSSIDEQTYNRIKLYFDNKRTGKRDVYIEEDSSNQRKWGILQYYEKLEEGEDGVNKAQKLLSLYNTPTRSLDIDGVEGDCSVRAGSSVIIKMTVGNKELSHYFFVESCTHDFSLNEHTMSLSVRGGALNE